MIEFELDKSENLSSFIVYGKVTWAEIKEATAHYYLTYPTQNVIWDMLKSELSSLDAEGIKEAAQDIKKSASVRKGGRTVFVVSGDTESMFAKLYCVVSESIESPIDYHIVETRDTALKWLGYDPSSVETVYTSRSVSG